LTTTTLTVEVAERSVISTSLFYYIPIIYKNTLGGKEFVSAITQSINPIKKGQEE
jgi:hypothetical protein